MIKWRKWVGVDYRTSHFPLASSVVQKTYFGFSLWIAGTKDGDGNQLLAWAEHGLQ